LVVGAAGVAVARTLLVRRGQRHDDKEAWDVWQPMLEKRRAKKGFGD
jgi:hypothetical protein